MNSSLLSGQAAMPLIRGIYYLLSAERARELTALLAKGAFHQEGETSPLAGAADLLGEGARFEDQDAFRLLALLLDKLLRGGRGSREAKLDGLTPSVMEQRALAATSPNAGSVVRGSWRRKSRNQLGHAS